MITIEKMTYKNYEGSIEYDKEDQLFFGHVLNVGDNLLMYNGSTREELEEQFHHSVDDFILIKQSFKNSPTE